MKIVRFIDDNNAIQYGIDKGTQTAELVSGDITCGFQPTGTFKRVVKRLAPILPPNIFAVGLNYEDHLAETGMERPARPTVFMKATSSIIGDGVPIRLPACELRGPETDYEAELGVIIGKPGRNIPVARATEHIFGYTAANDVSARRWQKHGGSGQWIRSKSFDTFCPLGPLMVTRDELDPISGIGLRSILNGQTMQDGRTDQMIHDIPHLVAYLSQDTTLLPGTLILTGTPAGVGFVRSPRIFLQPGDLIEVDIDGIGRLSNPVERALEPVC